MKYAVVFGLLGLLLTVYASALRGAGWLLLWPALSFLWMAAAYAGMGPGMLGKRADGRMTGWVVLVLLPYLLLTWSLWHLNRLLSKELRWNEIAPGLFLGRRISARELPPGVTLVVDLTAEFGAPRGIADGRTYSCLPVLDAQVPEEAALRDLVSRVAAWPGPVYLHCALGHGRSALVACAVLLARGQARNARGAEALVRKARSGARLNWTQRALLDRFAAILPPTSGEQDLSI